MWHTLNMEPKLMKLELMRHLGRQPHGNRNIRIKRHNPNLKSVYPAQVLKGREANQELLLPIWQGFPLLARTIRASPRHVLSNNIRRHRISINHHPCNRRLNRNQLIMDHGIRQRGKVGLSKLVTKTRAEGLVARSTGHR
jgi:hypothetical protein